MQNQELAKQLQKLRSLIKNAREASAGNIEMQAHWARYICILSAGFIENALKELYIDYAHRTVSRPVANFVSSSISQIRNPKMQRFIEVAGAFKESWKDDLEKYVSLDGRAEAIDSVMNNRHQIAHGKWLNSNVSLVQIKEYLDRAVEVLEFIEQQCK